MKNLARLILPVNLPTVNYHLQKTCNYNCSFCFAHFNEVTHQLDKNEGLKLIKMLKEEGNVKKINFAGGEPLLNEHLGDYIKYCREQDIKTSIVTNATKLTKSWLNKYGPYINQIAVSCDSLSDMIQKDLGRGFGQHTQVTKRAFKRIKDFNDQNNNKIQIKLNTVVTRRTHEEDWNNFIMENNVQRWKIFKILEIKGENDDNYGSLSITDEQFHNFVNRHEGLRQKGIDLAPEYNDDMINSYLMINPQGQFYQNNEVNEYVLSDSILLVGVKNAYQQIGGFSYDKFIKRGGEYAL